MSETIRCPLDDCGWAFDPAPSPLGADLSDVVREMIQNCRDQAIGHELRRHFANHDPRDILRTIGRLHAEHIKVADALAEITVKLHDNRAPGEDIVQTVLRIRTERDSLVERLAKAESERQCDRGDDDFMRILLLRAELDEARESRFRWAEEAAHLQAERDLDICKARERLIETSQRFDEQFQAVKGERDGLRARIQGGLPPDWARQLAACPSSGAGVDLVRSWLVNAQPVELYRNRNARTLAIDTLGLTGDDQRLPMLDLVRRFVDGLNEERESRFAWAREADRLEAELARAVDQGNGIAAGLLGLFINGEHGQPGYEAVRSRWMARTELQQRCDDLAAWRQGWSRSATSNETGEDLQCAAEDASRFESGEVR